VFVLLAFAFQVATTRTDAKDSPAVLPYAVNIYAAMLTGTFAVNGELSQAGACAFTGTFVSARSSYDQAGQQAELNFEHLVDFYYGPLYRFAMSLTRTECDAGDLVQDTFLAWAAKGHQLRDKTKVKAWLFTTLHRRFLESQRRIVRFPHVELDEATDDLPQVEPGLVDQLDAQTVVQMLHEVDAQFQAAVALFYLEDYSYNEIAAILEVPLGTVKSRIARGLAQLRLLVSKTVRSRTLPGQEPS
jgi:RNA polymerase sigma-70 factor (ECF subfamily)